MFKKHSIQVKMVKDAPSTTDVTVGDTLDAVNEMIAKNVKPVAVAVVAVIASKTLAEIALHTARTFIK